MTWERCEAMRQTWKRVRAGRIRFRALAIAIVVASLAGWIKTQAAPPTGPEPRRPNIILILSDDLGYGSVGCYGAPEGMVRTPAIDRLAREGRRFTDANTPSSVCSPTRYGVLTGRYCWRTSLKHEVLSVFSPLHIETDRPTLATLLKGQGYRTAAVGKWHLGYQDERTDYTVPLVPGALQVGFDYHFAVPSNHGDVTGVYVENDGVLGLRSRLLTPFGVNFYGGRPFMGIDAPQRVDEQVMADLTDRAIRWLDSGDDQTPFFLYYTPVSAHEPVTPSQDTRGKNGAGPYGDWIADLDLSVGRLLDWIDQKGLAENTLVIFTSDNGGENKKTRSGEQLLAVERGLGINDPWRAGKHSIYQGGFRVPFLVRWPGAIDAGTTCDTTMSLVDCYASLAALVGEPLPDAARAAEDSFNMLPAWLGRGPVEARPHMVIHSANGTFAIRRGDWKYIEGKPSQKPRLNEPLEPQLYNLRNDPHEDHNLIAAEPETSRTLQSLLDGVRDAGHSR